MRKSPQRFVRAVSGVGIAFVGNAGRLGIELVGTPGSELVGSLGIAFVGSLGVKFVGVLEVPLVCGVAGTINSEFVGFDGSVGGVGGSRSHTS